jgi:6-pyruvoyltetrahydropterin/6-carboxytetrahydropterin synthase
MSEVFRVCKVFEIESGHQLSKHPGRCRFPHGHSRRIEVVLSSEKLDENDMVCDFAAVKGILESYLDAYDHAMMVNSEDPSLGSIRASSERVIVVEGEDPTTEVLARRIYIHLSERLSTGEPVRAGAGTYRLAPGLRVERVRVGETSSTWAEYGQA